MGHRHHCERHSEGAACDDLSCWPPLGDLSFDSVSQTRLLELVGELGHTRDCAGEVQEHHMETTKWVRTM